MLNTIKTKKNKKIEGMLKGKFVCNGQKIELEES
jgi:hypothetical protein